MIKKFISWFERKKGNNVFTGSLIPIVKTIKYKNTLSNENVIRKQILNRMLPELMSYVVWYEEEQDDIIKLTGRIDVLKRDNVKGE